MPSTRYRVTVVVDVDAQTEDHACAIACRGMTGLEVVGVPDIADVQEVDYDGETVPFLTVFNDGSLSR